MVFVKICGITRPEDALASIEAGADAIGLNFVPTSHRRVDTAAARLILEAAAGDVMTVGVFRNHPVAEVVDIVGSLRLDAAQLHGDETPDDSRAVARHVETVIKVVTPGTPAAARVHEHGADIVMLDAPAGGGGVPFDWDLVGDMVERHRVLLAGGLHPDNVAEAVQRVRPWGVDVATGVESVRPLKDRNAIERFVTAARAQS